VVLGAAVGSAALIGALIVGDSVRQTLRDTALARLGPIHFAMDTGDRLFRSKIASDGLFRSPARDVFSFKTQTTPTGQVVQIIQGGRVVSQCPCKLRPDKQSML
jgi:hypothetical protein